MPGRVATFVICSKTPSSKAERSDSVAKMRAGTSIPGLWETGISQTVSEMRMISLGTGTARLPPAVLHPLYRGALSVAFHGYGVAPRGSMRRIRQGVATEAYWASRVRERVLRRGGCSGTRMQPDP